MQGHGLQRPILATRNFYGCLENFFYNDLNLMDLAKKSNQQVSIVVSQKKKWCFWKMWLSAADAAEMQVCSQTRCLQTDVAF